MKRTSEQQPIFAVDGSGSLVQIGTSLLFSVEDGAPHAPHNQTRDSALALKTLMEDNGLSIGKSPTLLKLFNDTVTNDVETFLYHVKLALRELKDVFDPTLGKGFKETTQYKHIADWSEKRFGRENALTRWLKQNCDWIEKLINSRNAVEHPDQHNLKIVNFHVDGGTIRNPSWSLDGEHPKSLLHDMKVLPTNILEFSEILLLYCLRNVKDISPLVIAEIPEAKRDVEAPVRFLATLAQDLDENGFYKGRH